MHIAVLLIIQDTLKKMQKQKEENEIWASC